MSATASLRSTVSRPSLRPGIADLQRHRIMTATLEAVGEMGYVDATTAAIIGRARVSRKTFYEAFGNREEALQAGCELTLSEARCLAAAAFGAEANWRSGMRAAVAGLLLRLEEDRPVARLWAIETVVAGGEIRTRRTAVVREIAEVLHDGGRSAGCLKPLPTTAEFVICGALGMLAQHLVTEPDTPLTRLYGPIMSMIVQPYLGAEAACEEAASSPPTSERQANSRPTAKAWNKGEFRVTTRTVRVLRAIASEPGASNQAIAKGAGIKDPGQISKLLRRLEGLGLVINLDEELAGGVTKSWYLTDRGAEFDHATRSWPGER